MARKEKQLKVFVPALALEHRSNSEYASRQEKIQAAVSRYFLKEDFFIDLNPGERTPYVFLKDIKFHPDALGYEVWATVKC